MRWSDLSPRQQQLVIVGGVADAVLKVAMLRDLRRRDAALVRGPKRLWQASTLIGSAGLIPAAYFVGGRRRER
ncbi:MAG: hypothetical protein R2731_04245 [Nocardioides sp.]